MKVYQLKNLPGKYQYFDLDPLALSKQLGKNGILTRIMRSELAFEPLLPYWGRVSHHFSSPAPKVTAIPDVSLWGSNFLVISQQVYDVIGSELAPYGEFLPITCSGEPYYAFNCLVCGQEDETLTEKRYLDGYEDGLESLAFVEDSVKDKLLFRSKMQGGSTLFCTQKFKDLLSNHHLLGLRFDEDLLAIF
ncbi:hypothetical protein ACPV4S_05855 [Vibrio alginolyticus]|uniref:hypothetical protein n=1 Tax=Vibrio alginolyticus TaxID=663 RepID=UPI0040694349